MLSNIVPLVLLFAAGIHGAPIESRDSMPLGSRADIAPDAYSTRSKWTSRADVAARNPVAEDVIVSRGPEEEGENYADCCYSTRSAWTAEEAV